jgi:hypothetical protein
MKALGMVESADLRARSFPRALPYAERVVCFLPSCVYITVVDFSESFTTSINSILLLCLVFSSRPQLFHSFPRSQWYPCLFDVLEPMGLPQTMACSNERPTLGKASLTGENVKRAYHSRWCCRMTWSIPPRDRHCRMTISSVPTGTDTTTVRWYHHRRKNKRYQREDKIE